LEKFLMKKPIVWTIAGSDSGAGAGIQADLKAAYELGVHGATILTSLTAQNSVRVTGVECPPTRFIIEQWDALSNDLPAKAIKLGMLASKVFGKPVVHTNDSEATPAWFDQRSVQYWTRGPKVWLLYEMLARLHHRLHGWM
jgi:hydroxymethylpyrimidine/phosphomethylpyrimidine kinase